MEESKLYVVIAVLLIILFGLFIYLFLIGNKVNKIERKLREMIKKRDRV